jgi:hypothetical protein
MTITLTEQAAVHLQAALETQAKDIAGAKLYTGTDAIKTFGLTRKSLTQLPVTMLPGRTKPLYSASSIVSYIKSRTK